MLNAVDNSIARNFLRTIALSDMIRIQHRTFFFAWRMVLLDYLRLNESNAMLTFPLYHFTVQFSRENKQINKIVLCFELSLSIFHTGIM